MSSINNLSTSLEPPLSPTITPPSPTGSTYQSLSPPTPSSPSRRPTPTIDLILPTPSASTSQLSLSPTPSPTAESISHAMFTSRRHHLATPSNASSQSRLTLGSSTGGATMVGSVEELGMDVVSGKGGRKGSIGSGSFNTLNVDDGSPNMNKSSNSSYSPSRSPSINSEFLHPNPESIEHPLKVYSPPSSNIISKRRPPAISTTSPTPPSSPKPKREKLPFAEPSNKASFMAIAKTSYLNILLIFIPISWAFRFAKLSDTLIFVFSFIAIIPLAALLGFGTDELSKRFGQTVGGLINATLGNIVELIIAILALAKCELNIVQSSLLGSILSNLLLVLGSCFFVGGIRYSLLPFKSAASSLSASLLFMATTSILVPVIFHYGLGSLIVDSIERPDLLKISRGTSVVSLVIYMGFLFSQLYSHSYLYDDDVGDEEVDIRQPESVKLWRGKEMMKRLERKKSGVRRPVESEETKSVEENDGEGGDDDDDDEKPEINKLSLTLLLVFISVLTGVTSEFLVDSIQGFTSNHNISQEFVGLILLPIIGNTAEHYSAILAAMRGKVDLAISISVGSGIQISVFVIPLMVVISWWIGKPLSLLFDPFEALLIFVASLMTSQAIAAGRANFLSGWILLCVYITMALAVWFYPESVSNRLQFFSC